MKAVWGGGGGTRGTRKNEIVTIMSILLVSVSVSVSVNTTVGGANNTIGGSKGGTRNAPCLQILSISCRFLGGEIWQNRMLAPPWRVCTPHLGEILDPPLITFLQKPMKLRNIWFYSKRLAIDRGD